MIFNKTSPMTFAYTIFYVPDVEAALSFYETAFGFSRRFVSPDGSYGELETGSTTLSFASTELAQSNFSEGFEVSRNSAPPFGFEIGVTTANVPAALAAALAAGATLLASPKTKPWGQEVAYVRDPNGFIVELCTPMG